MSERIDGKTYYDVQEVAAMFKVVPETVRRWAQAGRLPSRKLGLKTYISQKDLKAFQKERLP